MFVNEIIAGAALALASGAALLHRRRARLKAAALVPQHHCVPCGPLSHTVAVTSNYVYKVTVFTQRYGMKVNCDFAFAPTAEDVAAALEALYNSCTEMNEVKHVLSELGVPQLVQRANRCQHPELGWVQVVRDRLYATRQELALELGRGDAVAHRP